MQWSLSARSTLPALALALGFAGCGADGDDLFGPSSSGGSANRGGEATGAVASGGDGGSGASTHGGGGSTSAGGAAAGGGSGGATQGGSGGVGAGGGPVSDIGCSDGEREAYLDLADEPNIAACSGGFNVPGVTTPASLSPACARQAGDDSANPAGAGCSVEDLCSFGWHVCESAKDVSEHAESGECPPQDVLADGAIWITRQSQDDAGDCAAPPATNNVVGCGNMGDWLFGFAQCAPLDRRLRWIDCSGAAAWSCGANNADGAIEAELVVKTAAPQGGVLCCRD